MRSGFVPAVELHEPGSVDEAVALLNKYEKAEVIAGGSDLLGMMKDRVTGPQLPVPEHLIDIMTIPGFAGIERAADNTLRIGPGTTLAEVESSPEVQELAPALSEAAGQVATPQIRSYGTIGGNVCQRPRCWYFRDETFVDCYKRGGDFCYAVTGKNKYHCIIGGELCYIVHPSDTAVPLLALGAEAQIAGPNGKRTVPFDEFFVGPREDVLRENVLQENEILTGIEVPSLPAGTRSTYRKLKDRRVLDFGVVSVAATVTAEDGVWKDGRIVLGGVAPVPYRAINVEEALQGKNIADNITSAAARVASAARPMSENAYKVDLSKRLIEETVFSLL